MGTEKFLRLQGLYTRFASSFLRRINHRIDTQLIGVVNTRKFIMGSLFSGLFIFVLYQFFGRYGAIV